MEAIGAAFFTPRLAIGLLPKANVSSHPAPSGAEPSPKVPKPNDKLHKADKEKLKKNQPGMAKYTIKGEEVYRPYREFGYNEKGTRPKF